MFKVLLLFDTRPAYDPGVMHHGQDLFEITCNALQGLNGVLETERPDLVLLHRWL